MAGISLALILWSVAVLFFLLLTFVSAILALCLKEKKQLHAVDTFLVSATLLCAVFLSANLLVKDATKLATHKKYQKAVKVCDGAVQNIEEAAYIDDLAEPTRTIIASISATRADKLLRDAETIVQQQADDHPKGPSIAARLAIIMHAEGKETAHIFKPFREDDIEYGEGVPSSRLLSTLQQLYHKSEPGVSNGTKLNETKAEEIIKSELPKGWYQASALIDLYKIIDPIKLREVLARRSENATAWGSRVQSFLVLDAIILLLGLISLTWFAKLKKQESVEVIPLTTSFRRMYVCLISTIFAQVIAGGIIGLWIGFSSVASHTSADIGDYESLMNMTLVIAGVSFCLLLLYLLVLRPQKLSLNQAFTRSAEKLALPNFFFFVLGGFCAANVLNLIGRLIYHLLPGAGRPTNPAHLQMVKAFVAGDVEQIIKSVIFACLLAPFTEEIMFRGLLFGWLRKKVGSTPAMIISSLLFAAWHFDLNGFVQYFALGLVLSAVYNRTRNLWISILIHALWNCWVVSTVYWVTSYK